jgi:hypothetical protein
MPRAVDLQVVIAIRDGAPNSPPHRLVPGADGRLCVSNRLESGLLAGLFVGEHDRRDSRCRRALRWRPRAAPRRCSWRNAPRWGSARPVRCGHQPTGDDRADIDGMGQTAAECRDGVVEPLADHGQPSIRSAGLGDQVAGDLLAGVVGWGQRAHPTWYFPPVRASAERGWVQGPGRTIP